MKKGFVFTLVFSLFFLLLLYTASAYLNMLQMRQAALDRDESGREIYFADDVGYDYLSIWGMKTSISRDSSNAYWTIQDKIPNQISDMEGTIREYENFISGEYSKKSNINSIVELDRSGKIKLEPNGISYRHSARNDIIVDGSAKEYRLSIRLSKLCGGGCSSGGNWNWASEGVFVSLDITDANGSRIDVAGRTSGYVRLNETNTLHVPLENSGFFELRLSGAQMKMEFSNTGAETKTTLGVHGGSPLRVYVPVKLVIGEREFRQITLIEK